MPSPTWLYAQGFSHTWNATIPIVGKTVHRQPRADELKIQAMSAIAAGAKGLMWFQTELAEAKYSSAQQAAWTALANFNRDVLALRFFLLESAPTGKVSSTNTNVFAETLLSPNALIVPVINFHTGDAPLDIWCAAQRDVHWQVRAASTTLSVELRPGLNAKTVVEIQDGKILESTSKVVFEGGVVKIPGVELDSTMPVRLFVITGNANVLAQISQSLGK
jgi:hypothetical protein